MSAREFVVALFAGTMLCLGLWAMCVLMIATMPS